MQIARNESYYRKTKSPPRVCPGSWGVAVSRHQATQARVLAWGWLRVGGRKPRLVLLNTDIPRSKVTGKERADCRGGSQYSAWEASAAARTQRPRAPVLAKRTDRGRVTTTETTAPNLTALSRDTRTSNKNILSGDAHMDEERMWKRRDGRSRRERA